MKIPVYEKRALIPFFVFPLPGFILALVACISAALDGKEGMTESILGLLVLLAGWEAIGLIRMGWWAIIRGGCEAELTGKSLKANVDGDTILVKLNGNEEITLSRHLSGTGTITIAKRGKKTIVLPFVRNPEKVMDALHFGAEEEADNED